MNKTNNNTKESITREGLKQSFPALIQSRFAYQPNGAARRGWGALLVLLALCAWPLGLWADTPTTDGQGDLAVAVSDSALVQVSGRIGTVFVADPEIADVQIPAAGTVLVLGRRTGSTSLYVLAPNGTRLLQQRVVVRHNLPELQDLLRQRFPALRLTLTSAPGSLALEGNVPDAATAEAVERSIQHYLGQSDQLVNRLTIDGATQVRLQVRVTEVSKAVTQELGVNWQALLTPGRFTVGIATGRDFINESGQYNYAGGNTFSFLGGYRRGDDSLQAMIDLLDREGLVSILAEPNLTAVSGQTASFLAGGEFPVPVRQRQDSTTVEFKSFGVSLDFTPTVLADDRISIKVRPEFSEIDFNNSIEVDNLTIPGLSVRRVETTVEMASGQTFAIGGLLQNNVRDVLTRLPGLASIPVLGRLFSSSDYRNDKSELVVLVTPYIVRPPIRGQSSAARASMRADSDIEYILMGRVGFDPLAGDVPRLSGSAGFIY